MAKHTEARCPYCGEVGQVRGGSRVATCTRCYAQFSTRGRYSVQEANAEDVVRVITEYQRQRMASRGPWRAGLFYLLCLVVLATLILVISQHVSIWVLPVVVFAALLGVVVLGALQLRQDGRVSEKTLLAMVNAALRNAKSLGVGPPPSQPPAPGH